MSIEGKKVVVTGGSSGIGLASARALAGFGAEVVVASRSEEKLANAIDEIGDGVEARVLDVTHEGDVKTFFEEIGPFDHLVMAAGEQAVDAPVMDLDTSVARRIFEVKYWGQYHAIKHGAQLIRDRGSVVMFSAWLARKPAVGFPTYAAIDGAVESLARVLSLELAPTRVNVVSPGVIDTSLYDNLPEEAKVSIFEGVAATLPVERVGTAEDVAKAVLYLLENEFSTGAVVDVDGGHGSGS